MVFQSFHCGGYLCSFKLIGVRCFLSEVAFAGLRCNILEIMVYNRL